MSMGAGALKYLESLYPDLDARGQWACVGNAKTAQKSIMLGVLYGRQVRHRRGPRNWQAVWDNVFAPRPDDVLWFTFVRNPFDYVVSAFHFLQQRGEIASQWGFQAYVHEVLGVEGPSVNRHFREQHLTCTFEGESVPGMFVGRFEHLQRDWAYIAGRIGAQHVLPHRSQSTHKRYTEYYDDESREVVEKLYRLDLELLGYTFDGESGR